MIVEERLEERPGEVFTLGANGSLLRASALVLARPELARRSWAARIVGWLRGLRRRMHEPRALRLTTSTGWDFRAAWLAGEVSIMGACGRCGAAAGLTVDGALAPPTCSGNGAVCITRSRLEARRLPLPAPMAGDGTRSRR